MMTVDEIWLSALEHHGYCPRQAALIHVDGLWADNRHTIRGTAGHRRADTPATRRERGRHVARAVPVWSDRYGLTGRCDAVEIRADGGIAPVEYKIGERHGIAAELQLCGQALCLEEMFGVSIPVGYVWYSGPRRRDRVAISGDLRQATFAAIDALRAAMRSDRLPDAPADQRCQSCQLAPTCLPDVVSNDDLVGGYLEGLYR